MHTCAYLAVWQCPQVGYRVLPKPLVRECDSDSAMTHASACYAYVHGVSLHDSFVERDQLIGSSCCCTVQQVACFLGLLECDNKSARLEASVCMLS